MGQTASRSSSPSTQHVFASETPVRFSQELIDALQASPESDRTRAQDLELHIQSRVHAELARLEAAQSRALADLSAQISAAPDASTASSLPQAVPEQAASRGGVDQGAKAEGDRRRELGREGVQREIEALRAKLRRRRLREEVVGDQAVERARGEVVKCLRGNDRRPLDCWREVEAFKREVGRLERGFLERVLE